MSTSQKGLIYFSSRASHHQSERSLSLSSPQPSNPWPFLQFSPWKHWPLTSPYMTCDKFFEKSWNNLDKMFSLLFISSLELEPLKTKSQSDVFWIWIMEKRLVIDSEINRHETRWRSVHVTFSFPFKVWLHLCCFWVKVLAFPAAYVTYHFEYLCTA